MRPHGKKGWVLVGKVFVTPFSALLLIFFITQLSFSLNSLKGYIGEII